MGRAVLGLAFTFLGIGTACALYGLFSQDRLIGWFGALFVSFGGLFMGFYFSEEAERLRRELEKMKEKKGGD